ncbi:MAG: cryptochrome/photolyase family protein [Ferruginibacter sp.]
MKEIVIIFPHQLFKNHPGIEKGKPVYLVEEFLFFNQYNFHQQKILLHRASMKAFEEQLYQQKIVTTYIESKDKNSDITILIDTLAKAGCKKIIIAELVDEWLTKKLMLACKKNEIVVDVLQTPNFLNNMQEAAAFFDKKKTYFQTAFYIDQRKKRNILLTLNNEPEGGQWSFDADNRAKFPAKEIAPVIKPASSNEYVVEAKQYVQRHYGSNYGVTENFIFPVTHDEAAKWLDVFIKTRMEKFGIYEDAIVAKEYYLHHSVISPMLNIGLLNPQQVVDRVLALAPKYNIPLNSLEGFIRQVIGWREFIRIVYQREGTKQRTTNYWGFTRKIPPTFWNGTTGIEPIDQTIQKLLQTSYSHHIERLMVLGNFMLLCEFDPDDVHRWFMEMYIDAYDWVMVPNVYGMTQFADGGLMTTKPYISGSNYLMKMSDYKKGKWCEVWDGLFWRFMHVHRDFFSKNPRLGMLLNTWDKMPDEKRDNHLNNANNFLAAIDEYHEQHT